MIIHADDFGYSDSVNQAVVECFRQGLVNRTSIMVNMPGCEAAAKLAREEGFFDKVGLHINLTEGRPLTHECAKSGLCDENGCFTGAFHIPLSARLYLNAGMRRAIRCETEAQIKKYISMGFTLMHADSHNYTHVYFSVYFSIKKLFQDYGFRMVRISRNIPEGSFSPAFWLYKRLFNFMLRQLRTNGKRIRTTTYFGSVQDFGQSAKGRIKEDIELMTHPDYQNGILIDNTLPHPHPFVTRSWIEGNGLYLEDVSGKKIKMLVCFIQAHIGGAMTSLVNFLNAIDTERYDVDLMFYENGSGRYGIKPEIHILPQGKRHTSRSAANVLKKLCSPRYDLAALRSLYYKHIRHNKRKAVQILSKQGCRYSTANKKEYDLAVAYEFDWCLNYVMTRVRAGKKIAWHHLEYEKSGLCYKIDKRAFDKADALVFVSEDCRRAYIKAHPEHAAKSFFIPNLLSAEYVREKGMEDVALPFAEPGRYFKFLTVARINFEHKGLDRAVRAFARLKDDGLSRCAKWVIIGKGRDAGRLDALIAQYGLQDIVYPIGVRENPIPYMRLCDALLLPSRHEGKPMVVTEGFIMGLVPIVTRYTSAGEQIQDGTDGLIFENDEESLYRGLKAVLEHPEIIDKMRVYINSHDYGNAQEIEKFYTLTEGLLHR